MVCVNKDIKVKILATFPQVIIALFICGGVFKYIYVSSSLDTVWRQEIEIQPTEKLLGFVLLLLKTGRQMLFNFLGNKTLSL